MIKALISSVFIACQPLLFAAALECGLDDDAALLDADNELLHLELQTL
jgi:hypothetical protein